MNIGRFFGALNILKIHIEINLLIIYVCYKIYIINLIHME